MIKLISEKIIRVVQNKENLEKELNVKISNRGKEVYIEGEPEDEYIAEKIIEALDFGFPFSIAMQIKKDDLIFEILNVKEYAKQKNLERVRGRIIGKDGKTLKTIAKLSNCSLELKDNKIGLIGESEALENAEAALKLLLKGSKQANVYAYLEKHQPEPISDLGLKEIKRKK